MKKQKTPRKLIAFALIPTAIYFFYSAFLTLPITRMFFIHQLEENGPIELASFAMMTLAGIIGLVLAWRVRKKVGRLVFFGLILCGFGFFVIGMEEISWGQQFFGWETPEEIAWRNAQGETTLHNHHHLQEFLEILAIMFALSGLIGVLLQRLNVLRDLMPRPILFFWFVPLLVVASLDLMHEFWIFWHEFDELINYLDEVNEMICAMCALAFVSFKWRELKT